jgi:hypothetical protein
MNTMVRWIDDARDEPLETYIPQNYLADVFSDSDNSVFSLERESNHSRGSSLMGGYSGFSSQSIPDHQFLSSPSRLPHPYHPKSASRPQTRSQPQQLSVDEIPDDTLERSISILEPSLSILPENTVGQGYGTRIPSRLSSDRGGSSFLHSNPTSSFQLGSRLSFPTGLDDSGSSFGGLSTESPGSISSVKSHGQTNTTMPMPGNPRPTLSRWESAQSISVDHLPSTIKSPIKRNENFNIGSVRNHPTSNFTDSMTAMMNKNVGGQVGFSDSFLNSSADFSADELSCASPPDSPFVHMNAVPTVLSYSSPLSVSPLRPTRSPMRTKSPRSLLGSGYGMGSSQQRQGRSSAIQAKQTQRLWSPSPTGRRKANRTGSSLSSINDTSWHRPLLHNPVGEDEEDVEDHEVFERSWNNEKVMETHEVPTVPCSLEDDTNNEVLSLSKISIVGITAPPLVGNVDDINVEQKALDDESSSSASDSTSDDVESSSTDVEYSTDDDESTASHHAALEKLSEHSSMQPIPNERKAMHNSVQANNQDDANLNRGLIIPNLSQINCSTSAGPVTVLAPPAVEQSTLPQEAGIQPIQNERMAMHNSVQVNHQDDVNISNLSQIQCNTATAPVTLLLPPAVEQSTLPHEAGSDDDTLRLSSFDGTVSIRRLSAGDEWKQNKVPCINQDGTWCNDTYNGDERQSLAPVCVMATKRNEKEIAIDDDEYHDNVEHCHLLHPEQMEIDDDVAFQLHETQPRPRTHFYHYYHYFYHYVLQWISWLTRFCTACLRIIRSTFR